MRISPASNYSSSQNSLSFKANLDVKGTKGYILTQQVNELSNMAKNIGTDKDTLVITCDKAERIGSRMDGEETINYNIRFVSADGDVMQTEKGKCVYSYDREFAYDIADRSSELFDDMSSKLMNILFTVNTAMNPDNN